MMRLSLAAAVIALFAASQPAAAFGFDDGYGAYGYEGPKKSRGSAKAKSEDGKPLFSFGSEKKKSKAQAKAKTDGDDEDDTPKKKKIAKGPGEMDGGGQPNISAVAPPKVTFSNSFGEGSIVIDTAGRKLYYVLSSSQAYQYPIAVGREGFTWTGTQKISREVDWPDWTPPAEMLERKPELPTHMTGGIRNPLGAKALYLGNSLYRIHGTNDVKSIGTAASSGCIRMTNGHVVHLASISGVGTTVRVLSKLPANVAKAE
jgi:lipoprotein-anchoring transpeptidase ErfK/SrfK